MQTPARKALARLVHRAWGLGPNAVGTSAEQAGRNMERFKRGAPLVHLNWRTRPGAFLEEKVSAEDRALLRTLTSDDARHLDIDRAMLGDWGWDLPSNRRVFQIPRPYLTQEGRD